jgi:hypothetical protein
LALKEEDLLEHFPRLWHMAEDGSWDSIKKHGLLSTSKLLDLHNVTGDQRFALESQRRPKSVKITANGQEVATVRDNIPMRDSQLAKCLALDITPREWFELLNKRAFFWLSRDRLRTLLNAKAYRGRRQTVLTVDTAGLVKAHRDSIQLSPINSGATLYNPQPRGHDTFKSIADYPFNERRKTRKVMNSVAELVAIDGVPDIKDHLIAVHTVDRGIATELWRRPETKKDDGP